MPDADGAPVPEAAGAPAGEPPTGAGDPGLGGTAVPEAGAPAPGTTLVAS